MKRPVIPYRVRQAQEAEAEHQIAAAIMSADERVTAEFIRADMKAKAMALLVLNNYGRRPSATIVNYYTVQESKRSGFSVEVLLGKSHRHKVALARFRIWRQLRDNYGYSLPAIGRAFGRHHTTILSGLRKLERVEAASAVPEAT